MTHPIITDTDRQAAASAGVGIYTPAEIIGGFRDNTYLVKAFARHRETETARIVAQLRKEATRPCHPEGWEALNWAADAIERGGHKEKEPR